MHGRNHPPFLENPSRESIKFGSVYAYGRAMTRYISQELVMMQDIAGRALSERLVLLVQGRVLIELKG